MTAPTPESRVRIVTHQGKRIIHHDFTNIQNPAEAIAACARSAQVVRAEPLGSALTVTDVAGSRFNKDVLDALRDLVKGNQPYVKASALVGLTGLQKVAYVAITQLTGRRLPTFATLTDAMEWLVQQ